MSDVSPMISAAASPAVYVNFIDGDEGADRVRAAYGDNYARLAGVKR
jgi:Berberine and berberine like